MAKALTVLLSVIAGVALVLAGVLVLALELAPGSLLVLGLALWAAGVTLLVVALVGIVGGGAPSSHPLLRSDGEPPA